MAYVHAATREWIGTIVYWGPGMSGKSTTVKWLHDHAAAQQRGRLVRLATETEQPASFEFLPLSLGEVHGVPLRLHVYTTFGHVNFDKARKSLVSQADGIVLVADSHPDRQDANQVSREELSACLHGHEHHAPVSLVVQCNKRDLPDAVPVAQMASSLQIEPAQCIESVARTGTGVWEALLACAREVVGQADVFAAGAPSYVP